MTVAPDMTKTAELLISAEFCLGDTPQGFRNALEQYTDDEIATTVDVYDRVDKMAANLALAQYDLRGVELFDATHEVIIDHMAEGERVFSPKTYAVADYAKIAVQPFFFDKRVESHDVNSATAVGSFVRTYAERIHTLARVAEAVSAK